MKSLFRKVLVLGAHADDEFGCSGTMIRLIEAGCEIFYAVFSTCEESVPEQYPRDILTHELSNATKAIGIQSDHLFVYDYKVRYFPSRRQDILEQLHILKGLIKPDMVLLPALSDIHQDHHVISEEGLRAFKFSSVLGYELPMNTISFQHACFLELKERHVTQKVEALSCYQSQHFRNYAKSEFIWSLATVRGVQANCAYAEAFEVLRLIF